MRNFSHNVVFAVFHLLHIISEQLSIAHEGHLPFHSNGCSYISDYCNSSCVQELGGNFDFPLVAVNCSARNLTEFPTDLPVNTGKLVLSYNVIPRLNSQEMKKIRYLRELMIEENNISLISEGSFQNNAMMKTLKMGGNELYDLPSRIFKGLKNLMKLYLNRNRISRLQNGTFQNLISLIYLDLGENEISVIDKGAFVGLQHLTYLDLARNKLRKVFQVHFSKLVSLRTLKLGFNEINSLDSESFSNLLNLKSLFLDYNNLTFVPKEVFKPLKGLVRLDLGSNPIEFVSLEIFAGLRGLKFLNLSFSNIRVFHGTYLKKILPNLRIYLDHNPLDCNCDLLWLKEWFSDDSPYQNITFYDMSQVKCKYPKTLNGRSLLSLNNADFSCSCEYCQSSFVCVPGGSTCNCAGRWAGPSCFDTCQVNDTSSTVSYEMMCSSSRGKCFCSNMSEVCVDNAYLAYSNFSTQCVCKARYQGNGFLNCTDVDECAQAPSVCHSHADCINTEGSFQCVCLDGYRGDGVTCLSIKHHKTVAIVTATLSVVMFVALICTLIFCVAPKRIQMFKEARKSTDRRRKKKQSTRRYVDLYKIHELGFINTAFTQGKSYMQ